MDDDVRIDALEDLSGVDGVPELVLDELHLAPELVANTVHVSYGRDNRVMRNTSELRQDVVTQGSGAAGHENAPAAGGFGHGLLVPSISVPSINAVEVCAAPAGRDV